MFTPETKARGKRFTQVRLREGYSIEQVDAFVERCIIELARGPAAQLAPEDVQNVRFDAVRLQKGYDMGEVDAYLDYVTALLTELRGTQPS